MTLAEAQELGVLARAFEALAGAIKDAREYAARHPDRLVGLGLCKDISDAGSTGLTDDVEIPPDLAVSVLLSARAMVKDRLHRQGVEVSEGPEVAA